MCMVWVVMDLFDVVSSYLTYVGLIVYIITSFLMCMMFVLLTMWMKVLLELHIVEYSSMFEGWSTCFDAYSMIISLLSMYEVMGLHIYIALIDLE